MTPLHSHFFSLHATEGTNRQSNQTWELAHSRQTLLHLGSEQSSFFFFLFFNLFLNSPEFIKTKNKK